MRTMKRIFTIATLLAAALSATSAQARHWHGQATTSRSAAARSSGYSAGSYVDGCGDDACGDDACFDEASGDLGINYGPPPSEIRKTLMQWSYGTSFGGGPPGRDEPLESDRPDFTEATTTVGVGVIQIESGYLYTYDDEHHESAKGHLNENIIRIGMLAEWFELRFVVAYSSNNSITLDEFIAADGMEDLVVSCKLALTPQEGILPEMLLIPRLTLPTGHDDLTRGEVLAGLHWIYGWDVTDKFGTAGQTIIEREIDEVGRGFMEVAQSWNVSYSLTDRFSVYGEWVGIFPTGATGVPVEYFFDGGILFLVTNDLQLDVFGVKGLNAVADDYGIGGGVTVRF